MDKAEAVQPGPDAAAQRAGARSRAGARERQTWTGLESVLAASCTLLAVAILVLGFTAIYITIVPLLQQWWHWFAPLYLVLGEGSFALAFLGWMLLEMRDRLARRTRMVLTAYLAVFAAASLTLMVYASAGSFPDLVSHIGGCAAFFGGGVLAKVLVQRLAKDPEARAREQAADDARQYAIDLLRDRKGVAWRLRVPSLLRRQVATGRLPSAVTAATAGGAAEWELAVETWIVRSLTRGVKVAADEHRERAVITASSSPSPSPSAEPSAVASAPRQAPRRGTVSDQAAKRAKVQRLLETRTEADQRPDRGAGSGVREHG